MTPGQARAVAELRGLDRWSGGALTLRGNIDDSGPTVKVPIRVSTEGVRRYPGGMPVDAYEDLEIWIHDDAPLSPPYLMASDFRWAAYPHVTGRVLCLYIDPGSQWSPADGMFGFVHRMGEWLVAAAAGELDPDGGPLHPPVTLGIGYSNTRLVIAAEIPESEHRRLLWANLEPKGNDRFDVAEFHRFEPKATQHLAAVVLANQPLKGDYASTYGALAAQLEELGFANRSLAEHVIETARRNPQGTPLVVLVGTLNRRVAKRRFHHLVGWELPSDLADRFRALGGSDPMIDDADTLDAANKWAANESLLWTHIYEARESVTRRRDEHSAMSAFADKHIELWGCGALGGWIAEFIARAKPASLMLRDKATVGPGLVVRQPYGDEDITRPKAEALADRLRRIYGDDVHIKSSALDVVGADGISKTLDNVDLVIDATANRRVAAALDRFTAAQAGHPPIISVATDARCDLTAMFASPPTGAGPGYTARAALPELKRTASDDRLVDAFWGSPGIDDLVQPEPGCSAPTFHGSAADAASAASTLINQIARYLEDPTTHVALFTALPHAEPLAGRPYRRFEAPPPTRVEANDDYTVLLTESARASMDEIASNTFYSASPVETGGLLFGERDDAALTITIDAASGPPPDSTHSHTGFIRGTRDLDQVLAALGYGASERASYLGDWHTHPNGVAALSATDRNAAEGLVGDGASVLLIWAGTPEAPDWVAEVLHPDVSAAPPRKQAADPDHPAQAVKPRARPARAERAARKRCDAPMPPRRPLRPTRPARPAILLALSGGGFRATLAGLGVLRFLADADLLDDVRIISSVSGGSLANAAMATHWDKGRTQPAFDELILQPVLDAITSRSFLGDLIRNSWRTTRPGSTRTTVLADRLDKRFLHGHLLEDLPAGCWFMFNATNVSEGVRFRFDADVIGDYVNGSIATADTGVRVATAVAASAAVPGYFPALRLKHLRFPCNTGSPVDVADGGVYDNLGLEVIQRERDELENSFLISLNAGSQLAQGNRSSIVTRLPVAGALWRANAVMHRQTSALRTRRLFRDSKGGDGRPFVTFNLASEFPDDTSSDERERLDAWRNRNEEHTAEERNALASIPTTFAKLDRADALALVQRGWWLTGATLSVHHPSLLMKAPTWTDPLQPTRPNGDDSDLTCRNGSPKSAARSQRSDHEYHQVVRRRRGR